MKVLIVGIVVLALAVAGVSTYLIQSFGGEKNLEELQKQAEKPKPRVLVATRDLRLGEVLAPEAMAWQDWAEEAVNKLFIVVHKEDEMAKRMKDFEGAVVRRPISAGEPILASKVFKRDKPGFLSGVLDGGKRAVSFSVSPNTGASGFILPGDRVDVLLTHNKFKEALRRVQAGKKPDPDEPLLVLAQTTETILKDVKVIAVNQAVDLVEGFVLPASTITLELTPKQAEKLITARTMGKLSMTLRSLENPRTEPGKNGSGKPSFTTDVEVSPVLSNIQAILAEHRAKIEMKRSRKKGGTTKKRTLRKGSVVKIYRGGKAELKEIKVK